MSRPIIFTNPTKARISWCSDCLWKAIGNRNSIYTISNYCKVSITAAQHFNFAFPVYLTFRLCPYYPLWPSITDTTIFPSLLTLPTSTYLSASKFARPLAITSRSTIEISNLVKHWLCYTSNLYNFLSLSCHISNLQTLPSSSIPCLCVLQTLLQSMISNLLIFFYSQRSFDITTLLPHIITFLPYITIFVSLLYSLNATQYAIQSALFQKINVRNIKINVFMLFMWSYRYKTMSIDHITYYMITLNAHNFEL